MRNIWIWFWMMQKRLYKKKSFLAILLLIPAAVLILSLMAKTESGIVHIGLCAEEPVSSEVDTMIEDLCSSKSVLRFSVFSEKGEGIKALRNGGIDALWIFPFDLEEKTADYVKSDLTEGGLVTVLERETNIFLRLTHEKLTTVLMKYTAGIYYLNFARENAPALEEWTDAELMEYYDSIILDTNLFEVQSVGDIEQTEASFNYVLTPVRGFMGIIMSLAALAAAMYHLEDLKKGVWDRIPKRMRILLTPLSIFVATLQTVIPVVVSLFVVGLANGAGYTIGSLLIYAIVCSAIATLLSGMFPSVRALAAVLPVVVVAQIGICPVFFDLRSMKSVQPLLPATYLVGCSYDPSYLIKMVLYASVCLVLFLIIEKKRNAV